MSHKTLSLQRVRGVMIARTSDLAPAGSLTLGLGSDNSPVASNLKVTLHMLVTQAL
jgi:hypothetical protein